MRYPTTVRGAVGGSGTGKTVLLRASMYEQLAEHGDRWPFVVRDVNEEIGDDAPVRAVYVRTPDGARRALDAGRPLVIYRPPPLAEEDSAREGAEALAAAIVASDLQRPRHLVIPEAHEVLPEGRPVGPALRAVILRYQHPRVRTGLWWDTQLPAEIRKTVIRQSTTLYMFASGLPDEELRRIGGPGLVVAVRRAGELHDGGERGWYVRLAPQAGHRDAYTLRRWRPGQR